MLKIIWPVLFIFLWSCSTQSIIEIVNFSLNNKDADTIVLPMDLSDVQVDGIRIPSYQQMPNGKIPISFTILNSQLKSPLFYKIYYQNESYKIPETASGGYNPLSSENFYGSWEEVETGFKSISATQNEIEIKDSIAIIGNPRNEDKFKGAPTSPVQIDGKILDRYITSVRNSEGWMTQIYEKAKIGNISVDEQVKLDALWAINYDHQFGEVNNRWKRNPRVGEYKFMVVVTDSSGLNQIPLHIKDISLTENDQFVNPFYFFLHGPGSQIKGVFSYIAPAILKVNAKLNFDNGLYVEPITVYRNKMDTSGYSDFCNSRPEKFNKSHFEQYFHHINKNFAFYNVPVVADVLKEDYTLADYLSNAAKYDSSQRLISHTTVSQNPGKTVVYNPETNSLKLINPGNKSGELRKENVGIISRIGFTYGKFRAKIKFPEILNDSNMWTGVTNAFWLLYQEGAWNQRRICSPSGYLPKWYDGDGERVPTNEYSEIDIEIVKASALWKNYDEYMNKYYGPGNWPPISDEIVVASTNWDLACEQPENYFVGSQDIKYKDNTFNGNRWNPFYKALTIKTLEKDNEVLGKIFYFEIEWKPEEIIWRIGPSPSNMHVIGYMNSKVTSIPNNQMRLLITQEFHHDGWWPSAPYHQDLIPFPKEDIVGEVYDVVIE